MSLAGEGELVREEIGHSVLEQGERVKNSTNIPFVLARNIHVFYLERRHLNQAYGGLHNAL
jgi:hypothetical protein